MSAVRVLVVDDAPDVRSLVRAVINLHDRGWEVIATAGDGQQAIVQAAAYQPDLILLDLAMPVMDGLQALPLVRDAARNAVVVVLTGYPSEAARDTCLAAGAHGYLEKEDIVATLIPRLERILAAGAHAASHRAC